MATEYEISTLLTADLGLGSSNSIGKDSGLISALQSENRKLTIENQCLRKCVVLMKENAELKTANLIGNVIGWSDDQLQGFLTGMFLGDRVKKASPFRPISPAHLDKGSLVPQIAVRGPSPRTDGQTGPDGASIRFDNYPSQGGPDSGNLSLAAYSDKPGGERVRSSPFTHANSQLPEDQYIAAQTQQFNNQLQAQPPFGSMGRSVSPNHQSNEERHQSTIDHHQLGDRPTRHHQRPVSADPYLFYKTDGRTDPLSYSREMSQASQSPRTLTNDASAQHASYDNQGQRSPVNQLLGNQMAPPVASPEYLNHMTAPPSYNASVEVGYQESLGNHIQGFQNVMPILADAFVPQQARRVHHKERIATPPPSTDHVRLEQQGSGGFMEQTPHHPHYTGRNVTPPESTREIVRPVPQASGGFVAAVPHSTGSPRYKERNAIQAHWPDQTGSEGCASQVSPHSYEQARFGPPVATSTPIRPSSVPITTHEGQIVELMMTRPEVLLQSMSGSSNMESPKRAKAILNRHIDSVIGCRPVLSKEKRIKLSKFKPTQRLIGEVAFQLDRRILEYVFAGKQAPNEEDKAKRRRRFYGFTVANIGSLIRKEATGAKGRLNTKRELEMRYRFDQILRTLQQFGYSLEAHGDFSQDMVNQYGLLSGPPDRQTVQDFALEDPVMLRIVLGQLLPDDAELHNILILLDCLCLLSYQDKKPMFNW